jgi:UDP-N-acetylmuramoyl-tripeptide--D-alanyl-D-alanine ligase
LFVAFALLLRSFLDQDPRQTGKLRLQMTPRATRLLILTLSLMFLALFLTLLIFVFLAYMPALLLSALVLFQATAFAPALAGKLIAPLEERINLRFIAEAQQRFRDFAPYCIGITGSFGKTSTKSLLGQVLNVTLAPTFWPQKGINTLLGTTREIREKLSRHQRFAVIEMGAYYIGSIKKIAQLTPPQAAIVTAVGTMHLDRFGSAENIYTAKSELPQALPADGILVCNGDNPGARRMCAANPKALNLLYGFDTSSGHLDCVGHSLRFTENGSEFSIRWKSVDYPVRSQLLGKPAASNMLGAFAMSCALGAQPDLVVAAFGTFEPVDNRLALKKRGGVRFLNDAYNSNPVGFKAALEVLEGLPAKRRILMTPGMVELGETQAAENQLVATLAARICNFVIVVAQTNRSALLKGLREGGLAEEQIIIAETRTEAFGRLESILSDGDVVLIENDLPDKLEFKEKF